jgi:hypothetical protein
MSKNTKLWLGILSFLPLVLSFIIAGLVIKNFVGLLGLALEDAPADVAGMYIVKDYIVITIFSVFTALLNFCQMLVFIILCVKNDRLENNSKILYIVFLIIFSNITALVYFFMEIVSEKKVNLNK